MNELQRRDVVGSGSGPQSHSAADPAAKLLRFFKAAHLSPALQAVSAKFESLAHELMASLPAGPEKTAGLRKLLEAKDCCVRAALPEE